MNALLTGSARCFSDFESLSILATTDTPRRILNGTLTSVIIFFGPFLVSLFTETSYLFTNCSLRANQIYFTVLPPISIWLERCFRFLSSARGLHTAIKLPLLTIL